MDKDLYTKEDVCRLLSVSIATLRRVRLRGHLIPFKIPGTRLIRYRRSDIDRFLEQHSGRSLRLVKNK